MKNLWFGLFMGLIAGVLLTVWIGPQLAGKNMFITTESPYSFEETTQKLKDATLAEGWKLQKEYNLQSSLAKHGYNVLPVKVYSICNPEHASKILSGDEHRVISTMMPCRIAVYQKENGITYISRMNAAMMASQMGGLVEEVMKTAGLETEDIISQMMK